MFATFYALLTFFCQKKGVPFLPRCSRSRLYSKATPEKRGQRKSVLLQTYIPPTLNCQLCMQLMYIQAFNELEIYQIPTSCATYLCLQLMVTKEAATKWVVWYLWEPHARMQCVYVCCACVYAVRVCICV